MWFQEAYSRSSVSTKCTGSMMRRPSALGGGCQAGKRKEKRKSGFWDCQAGICKNILTTICCCIKMRVTNNT